MYIQIYIHTLIYELLVATVCMYLIQYISLYIYINIYIHTHKQTNILTSIHSLNALEPLLRNFHSSSNQYSCYTPVCMYIHTVHRTHTYTPCPHEKAFLSLPAGNSAWLTHVRWWAWVSGGTLPSIRGSGPDGSGDIWRRH